MDQAKELIYSWLEGPQGIAPLLMRWLLALIIILVGWLVCKIIASGIQKALGRTSLDEKLANLMGQDADGAERAIATFIKWLLMLFVVIFALSVAGQSEVVRPLRDVFDSIVSFIPNLIGAVVIGFIAYLLATVVKNVLTSLLNASRVDERLGLEDTKPITTSAGLIAFYGIILMMLPSALDFLNMDEIAAPIAGMIDKIFSYLPHLFTGAIIFAIGYLIASIVQKVLNGVLSSIGVDSLPARLGYTGGDLFGKPLSSILSYVAMATILVIIGAEAINQMKLEFISENISENFVEGYFKVLLALIILAVAFYLANIVGQLLESKSPFWARVVRIAIITFLGAAALQTADITDLTNETFQLIIYCAIIAAAFAVGVGGAIAIGLGGREKASSWLSRLK